MVGSRGRWERAVVVGDRGGWGGGVGARGVWERPGRRRDPGSRINTLVMTSSPHLCAVAAVVLCTHTTYTAPLHIISHSLGKNGGGGCGGDGRQDVRSAVKLALLADVMVVGEDYACAHARVRACMCA